MDKEGEMGCFGAILTRDNFGFINNDTNYCKG